MYTSIAGAHILEYLQSLVCSVELVVENRAAGQYIAGEVTSFT